MRPGAPARTRSLPMLLVVIAMPPSATRHAGAPGSAPPLRPAQIPLGPARIPGPPPPSPPPTPPGHGRRPHRPSSPQRDRATASPTPSGASDDTQTDLWALSDEDAAHAGAVEPTGRAEPAAAAGSAPPTGRDERDGSAGR